MSYRLSLSLCHTHTHTHSLSLSLSPSPTNSHTLHLTFSLTYSLSFRHLSIPSHSHSLTHTLSQTLSLSLTLYLCLALSLPHPHTHVLPHTHSLSPSVTHTFSPTSLLEDIVCLLERGGRGGHIGQPGGGTEKSAKVFKAILGLWGGGLPTATIFSHTLDAGFTCKVSKIATVQTTMAHPTPCTICRGEGGNKSSLHFRKSCKVVPNPNPLSPFKQLTWPCL